MRAVSSTTVNYLLFTIRLNKMKLLVFNFILLTQHQLIPYWFPCITKCATRTLPLCSANRHWTGRAHVLVYSFLVGYLNQELHIVLMCLVFIFLKSKISSAAHPRQWDSKCIWEVTHMAYAWRGAQLHIQTPAGTWCFSLFICVPKGLRFVCLLWKWLVLPQTKEI